ncbi:hypothetical protein [Marinomonas transparens]|uniref:DUF4405 domain-containing protein n=1 Tax=Marinomonas transparens TaxID=2795388 RepID=A0A934MX03_9GAMM|nr:hypothetical protein [Marinomonas transparens]MBJ7538764.1 hypothetical protein [Marinomonas transparens]
MKQWFMSYSTPLFTGLFLVSLVSGVALFFHIEVGWFHAMHEWLSMVLILPFVLHLWRNWRPFVNYFKRSAMVQSLVISTIAAVLFVVWPAGEEGGAGGPPPFAFSQAVISQSPEIVAPVFEMSASEMVVKLKDSGFASAEESKPLADIAKESGKNVMALYVVLTPKGN